MKGLRSKVFLLIVSFLLLAGIGYSQAIITNGSGIYLGVNRTGNLNVPDGTGGITLTPVNSSAIGLYFAAVDADGTAPGCLCEGWGVSVNGTTAGYADIDAGGTSNLTVDSFTSTASTATSIVHLTNLAGISVKQEYSPSTNPSLMQDVVTITNTTGSAVSALRYERTMDWDIFPTTFDENVTIQGWPAADLLHSEDNGFNVPNPLFLSGPQGCAGGAVVNVNFVDSGPCDHGADFVFDFGSLANTASKTFTIFYGAAGTEAAALAALGSVGAEVYSFGQCATGGAAGCSALLGTPATYIFGFQGVGGTPIVPPTVPEPSTVALLGSGLIGIVWRMRKNRALAK
jgi:type IV pilus assembly protein PilY1